MEGGAAVQKKKKNLTVTRSKIKKSNKVAKDLSSYADKRRISALSPQHETDDQTCLLLFFIKRPLKRLMGAQKVSE